MILKIVAKKVVFETFLKNSVNSYCILAVFCKSNILEWNFFDYNIIWAIFWALNWVENFFDGSFDSSKKLSQIIEQLFEGSKKWI